MVIVLKSRKGFSMLEMLACMCIISAFMLISLANTNKLNLQHYDFLNEYLYSQSKAILNKESVSVGNGLYFNNMGHINQAKTIEFFNHKVIVHLGTGYATTD